MTESTIVYQRGIPEGHRPAAAELYDEAFGAKFAAAIPSRADRLDLLARSFQLDCAIAALGAGELLGLAGFQQGERSLTSGITGGTLVSSLGILRGIRAALIFGLYERDPEPGEMVMDGIAVRGDARGQGIGSRLLEELHALAAAEGFRRICLDVIDSNERALKLYQRQGFVAVRTERFEWLRWLLGFGASTTMERVVRPGEGIRV